MSDFSEYPAAWLARVQAEFERRVALAARRLSVEDKPRGPSPPSRRSEVGKRAARESYEATRRCVGAAKILPKKRAAARPRIEIFGDKCGERFEADLAAIKRALKGSPFIALGNCLRHASAEFEWTIHRRVGGLATKLQPATVEDLRREARKRVRFSRPRTSLHFAELIRRAGRAPRASCCFAWLRIDSDGKILASSPALHFGQHRKF